MAVERLLQARVKIREIAPHPSEKLLSHDQACAFINKAHEVGKSVVLIEGVWDLTHPGHVQHIREAKKHADLVVLKLASAEYAKHYKGADRPIETFRDMMVSELENVDAVLVEESLIPAESVAENARILMQLRPDKVAMEIEDEQFQQKFKTVDYANRHLGAHIEPVVMVLPYMISTTAIVNKIRNLPLAG
ncbi:adenylyltransferase/cytidyltransferase family protein [Candidatus Woesebacteria bacterium]|nr:adenylyltransferase/cytidyltransferase family protein [Candidatus Woesebacteria bacterium]